MYGVVLHRPLPRGGCKEYVCLVVCPLVQPHGRALQKLLCMLPMAAAWSSSGGVAIRYILPVLWMTSHFHIYCASCVVVVKRRCNTSIIANISTKFGSTTKTSKQLPWVAHRGRNLISTIDFVNSVAVSRRVPQTTSRPRCFEFGK